MIASEQALAVLTSQHRQVIGRFLDDTANNEEWLLKAFLDEKLAVEALLQNNPWLSERFRKLPSAPGARYFLEKKLREEAQVAAIRAGKTATELLEQAIQATGVGVRTLPLRGEVSAGSPLLLKLALLIPRGQMHDVVADGRTSGCGGGRASYCGAVRALTALSLLPQPGRTCPVKRLVHAVLRVHDTGQEPVLPDGLRCVTSGDIAVAYCDASLESLTPSLPRLQAFARAVAEVHRHHTTIPFRFGCTVDSDAQLVDLLSDSRFAWVEALDRVQQCDEYSVHLPPHTESPAPQHQTDRTFDDQQAFESTDRPGTNYLMARYYNSRPRLGRPSGSPHAGRAGPALTRWTLSQLRDQPPHPGPRDARHGGFPRAASIGRGVPQRSGGSVPLWGRPSVRYGSLATVSFHGPALGAGLHGIDPALKTQAAFWCQAILPLCVPPAAASCRIC